MKKHLRIQKRLSPLLIPVLILGLLLSGCGTSETAIDEEPQQTTPVPTSSSEEKTPDVQLSVGPSETGPSASNTPTSEDTVTASEAETESAFPQTTTIEDTPDEESPTPGPEVSMPQTPTFEDTPSFEPLQLDTNKAVLNVPLDFSRIQQAIEAASDGDAILVDPGTYYENIEVSGKSVIITSKAGPLETTIDGGRKSTAITFLEGSGESVLHGFTVTNGLAETSGSVGGGICIENESPTVSSCIVTNNGAVLAGGAIYISGEKASPLLENNLVKHNVSTAFGGGIEIREGARPVVRSNVIIDNWAMEGAGIFVADHAAPVIAENTINDNKSGWCVPGEQARAYLEGIDITEGNESSTRFPCTIMAAQYSEPIIRENTITGNIGGGVCILVGSSANVEGNFISENEGSLLLAGGVMVALQSTATIQDNIITGNENGAIWVDDDSTYSGENQITGEIHRWPEEIIRPSGGRTAATLSVPSEYATIQDAIEAAGDGNTVIVSPGTYNENLDLMGKAITLTSLDPEDSDIVAATIIQAGDKRSTIRCTAGEGRDTVIEGFTITNTTEEPVFEIRYSSPTITRNIIRDSNCTVLVCVNAPDLVIRGNIIEGNTTHGGCIRLEISRAVVEDNIIRNNHGSPAISTYFASPTIVNNTISGNDSNEPGGGISLDHFSLAVVKSNSIANNVAPIGGGIYLDCFSNAELDGNIIADNQSHAGAGMFIVLNCFLRSTNNIIARNNAAGIQASWSNISCINDTIVDNSSAFYASDDSELHIVNCILWNQYEELELYDTSQVFVNYCDIEDGWDGNGNFSRPPGFENNSEYHLGQASPCIDAGSDEGIYTDIDGEARPQGNGFDIGADEYAVNS